LDSHYNGFFDTFDYSIFINLIFEGMTFCIQLL